jgi:hypothetical protein
MRPKSRVYDVKIAALNEPEEMVQTSYDTCDSANDDECDACPCCNDTCRIPTCLPCQEKTKRPRYMECHEPEPSGWLMGALASVCPRNEPQMKSYSMCQLRRHNTLESAWILVGNEIYDATPYIRSHPGGTAIILKKAGGATDCSEDMNFHSKRAQKEWKRHKVGNLCLCPRCP